MALVGSCNSIEEEIIRQAPPLNELKVVTENRDFLDYFGSRCLIVLDRYGEDSENVTKLLTSIRSRCSFLVTSLPDATPEFDALFDTIGEIQALTKNQVEQLVSYVPGLEPLALPLAKLCVEESMVESQSLSPMLILFLCILVDNGELDVNKRHLSLDDVYVRLVRYLHNKYSSSNYESSGVDCLKELAKVALKGLSENRHSFQRREIDERVFRSGFLVSEEDDGSEIDSEAGGVLSFVHIFFQYYFAFLHVVLAGSSPEKEFMSALFTLPRFCEFCLQLFRTDTMMYGHEIRTNVYTKIKLLFVKKINNDNLEVTHVIKMCRGFKLNFQFVHTALSMCKKIKHILLDSNLSDSDVLIFKPIWSQLLSVQLFDLKRYITPEDNVAFSPESLALFTDTPMVEKVKRLVHTFKAIGKKLHLYWFGQVGSVNLSEFPIEYLEELHINPPKKCKLILGNIHAAHLTRLSLCNVIFDDSVNVLPLKMLTQSNLPKLTGLSFADSNVLAQLSGLFRPTLIWPTLRHLDLRHCELNTFDFRVLETASQNRLLPQLDSLFFSHWCMNIIPILLVLPKITVLHMDSVSWEEFKVFLTLMNTGMLPKLKGLQVSITQKKFLTRIIDDRLHDIAKWLPRFLVERFPDFDSEEAYYWLDFLRRLSSKRTIPIEHIETLIHLCSNQFGQASPKKYTVAKINSKFACLRTLDFSNSFGIPGHLVAILSHSFPIVNTLILSNCSLGSEDLKIRAKVYSENKLPLLEHLDISENELLIYDKLESLFEYGSKWESLLTFCVQKSSPYWLSYLGRKFQSGCLGSLQELKVDVNESVLAEYYTIWPSLRKLHFYIWPPRR